MKIYYVAGRGPDSYAVTYRHWFGTRKCRRALRTSLGNYVWADSGRSVGSELSIVLNWLRDRQPDVWRIDNTINN